MQHLVNTRSNSLNARVCSQVYDSQAERWLPSLPVDIPLGTPDLSQPVIISDSEQLAAAMVADTSEETLGEVLVVWGVQTPSVQLGRNVDVRSLRWLPGTTSLLVLGNRQLARLDLDPAALPAQGLLELDWVPIEPALACMDLVPGTSSVLLVENAKSDDAEGPTFDVTLKLSLYDTAHLTRQASWSDQLQLPLQERDESSSLPDVHIVSVRCTAMLAAVSVGDLGTAVYSIPGERLLFWAQNLTDVSFDSSAHFLAGLTDKAIPTVYDARTGAGLVVLDASDFWTGSALGGLDFECSRASNVSWTASGQLRILACS